MVHLSAGWWVEIVYSVNQWLSSNLQPIETRLTKGNQNNELKDTKAATTAKSGDILIHLSSFFLNLLHSHC